MLKDKALQWQSDEGFLYQSKITNIDEFAVHLRSHLQTLTQHPIYDKLTTLSSLRCFMESHVFAVWDFMTLLKSLQHRLAGTQIPWTSSQDGEVIRLINEIVLAEESDEISPGRYMSHFEMYLMAMDEVGANTQMIQRFLEELQRGKDPYKVIQILSLPTHIASFLETTWRISQGPVHQLAASFLFGREEIIPQMFQQILHRIDLNQPHDCPSFCLYLQRHIALDEEQHAPMGRRLLTRLCENDSRLWNEALEAAMQSLQARFQLWDGVLRDFQRTQ